MWMRTIKKHIMLIKLIYERAQLWLPKISVTFLFKKKRKCIMCSPLYGPCEEGAGPWIQRIVHSSRVVAVYVNNDHVVTVTAGLGLLCTSCLIRLSNLLDPSQSTHLYQMGLYLYSLIKKYIKVASTVIYPWPCGVAVPPVMGNEHAIWVQAIQMHMTACLVFWIKGNISGSTC